MIEKFLLRTNLWPSLATMASASGVKSKYTPFIIGLNSSLAVANRLLEMLSIRTVAGIMIELAASVMLCVRG